MRPWLSLVIVAVACGGSAPPPRAAVAPAPDPHHGHHGHHAHHVDHDFTDAAAWAKVFDDPARDEWQRPTEVMALVAAGPGQTVVDLGTGTGYFVPYLARAVGGAGRVLAIDSEQTMVDHVTGRAAKELLANVTARRSAPDDPQLPAAAIDRILIVDTWHHLPDRAVYAPKLAAALRPGGAVIVVDFTLESPMGPPPAMRLSADAVVAELVAAGLDARIATETLPHQYVVIAHKPTGRSR